jgi:hypothetical protein
VRGRESEREKKLEGERESERDKEEMGGRVREREGRSEERRKT